MTLTISVVASILVIGALIASPDAYSAKNNDVLDECKCEKPHTLTVLFDAPDGAPIDTTYRVEIFKKLDDRDDEGKQLGDSILVMDNGNITVFASNFGKDKLESNTAFVIYEVDAPEDADPVALLEIHTSCSKPLFKDMVVDDSETTNNGFKLIVVDGLSGDPALPSIPIAEPIACEDEKKKSTGTITVKKALTNDNGGTAIFSDFEITVTNENGDPFDLVQIGESSIFSIDVPAGTYKLSEILPDPDSKGTYTTVLIAGDTGCPSMLEEVFTIKKNKNLSCTIYNDDKSTGSGGLNDFVFQKKSLKIDHADDTLHQSCKAIPTPSPCIEIIDSANIAIVDPKLESTSTIVLFSVFGEVTSTSIIDSAPACVMSRLIPHENIPSAGPAAGTTLSVILECANFDTPNVYNINYVFINPINVP